MENVGWAPIYNYKNTSIVLTSEDNQTSYSVALETDIRRAKKHEEVVAPVTIST